MAFAFRIIEEEEETYRQTSIARIGDKSNTHIVETD